MFGQNVATSAGHVGRRSVLVAASSGIVLTMAAPGALAAPDSSALPAVDVNTLTQQARVALHVSPTVVVPADAEWSIAAPEVTATKPAPVVVRAAPAASRTGTRTSTSTSTGTAAVQSAAAQNYSGSAVVDIALRYVGTPYVLGGSTPAAFDCSGFTQYVFAQVGINIPRSSAAQRYAGTVVSAADARPGDLMWWSGHVAIYMGNGMHIAARNPGTPLSVSPIYRSGAIFIRVG